MRGIDLQGRKFGRLTVLAVGGRKHRQLLWRCLCDCGNDTSVTGQLLREGLTRSCGCLQREVTTARSQTHGLRSSKEYGVWWTMLHRCVDPKSKSYRNYGGRGIKVCERWRDFAAFYEDMGPRPSDQHSIERRENDGDYEADNCFWATKAEQVANKRNTHLITVNGETKHLAEWARLLEATPAAILYRLKRGWTPEQAVTEPIPERPNSKLTAEQAAEIKAKYQPRKVSAERLAKEYSVSKKSILNILSGRTFTDVIPASL